MTAKKKAKKKSLLGVLSSAKKWIRNLLGVDRNNRFVVPGPREKKSVQYCLLGAACKLHGENSKRYMETIRKMSAAIIATPEWATRATSAYSDASRIAAFNNDRTTKFDDIKALIKNAGV